MWIDPLGLKKKKCNDPCGAMNHATWARQWQGHGIYKGKDNFKNVMLKKGTIIYGGAPGQTGFYFDKITLAAAGGSKQKLWESVQVLENRRYGYRSLVQTYEVKKNTCVAMGIAQAQISTPEYNFGDGGGTQFFLSNFKKVLKPVGNHIKLN